MSKIKLSYDFSDFKKDVMVLQEQHLQSNQKESYEKIILHIKMPVSRSDISGKCCLFICLFIVLLSVISKLCSIPQ